MIKSFKDKATEEFYEGGKSKAALKIPSDIRSSVRRKLDYINRAALLDDLKVPPGNRLEALSGDRKGFHSIRINDQWRIIFKWGADNQAEDVQITDYH